MVDTDNSPFLYNRRHLRHLRKIPNSGKGNQKLDIYMLNLNLQSQTVKNQGSKKLQEPSSISANGGQLLSLGRVK